MLLTQKADIFIAAIVLERKEDTVQEAQNHRITCKKMATNVLPPLSIGNITTFQGFTTTEAAKVQSPPSSLSKGRSGARAHRVGGKGEGRGGRHGSGEVDALKEKGQKKSLLRDIDPARFVLALDLICR